VKDIQNAALLLLKSINSEDGIIVFHKTIIYIFDITRWIVGHVYMID